MMKQSGKRKKYLGQFDREQCQVFEVKFAEGDLLSYSGSYTIGCNNYVMYLVVS